MKQNVPHFGYRRRTLCPQFGSSENGVTQQKSCSRRSCREQDKLGTSGVPSDISGVRSSLFRAPHPSDDATEAGSISSVANYRQGNQPKPRYDESECNALGTIFLTGGFQSAEMNDIVTAAKNSAKRNRKGRYPPDIPMYIHFPCNQKAMYAAFLLLLIFLVPTLIVRWVSRDDHRRILEGNATSLVIARLLRALESESKNMRARAMWHNHIVVNDASRILIPESFESRYNAEVAPVLEMHVDKLWDDTKSRNLVCAPNEHLLVAFSLAKSGNLPAGISYERPCTFHLQSRRCVQEKRVSDIRDLALTLPSSSSRHTFAVRMGEDRAPRHDNSDVPTPRRLIPFGKIGSPFQIELSDGARLVLQRYCGTDRQNFAEDLDILPMTKENTRIITIYELKRLFSLWARSSGYFLSTSGNVWDRLQLSRLAVDPVDHSRHTFSLHELRNILLPPLHVSPDIGATSENEEVVLESSATENSNASSVEHVEDDETSKYEKNGILGHEGEVSDTELRRIGEGQNSNSTGSSAHPAPATLSPLPAARSVQNSDETTEPSTMQKDLNETAKIEISHNTRTESATDSEAVSESSEDSEEVEDRSLGEVEKNTTQLMRGTPEGPARDFTAQSGLQPTLPLVPTLQRARSGPESGNANAETKFYRELQPQSGRGVGDPKKQTQCNRQPQPQGGGGLDHANTLTWQDHATQLQSGGDVSDGTTQTQYNSQLEPRGRAYLDHASKQTQDYRAPQPGSARDVGDANTLTPPNRQPKPRGVGGVDPANTLTRQDQETQPQSAGGAGDATTQTQYNRQPQRRGGADLDYANMLTQYHRSPQPQRPNSRDWDDANTQTPFNRRPQPRGRGDPDPANMQTQHYRPPQPQGGRDVGDVRTQIRRNRQLQQRGRADLDDTTISTRDNRSTQPQPQNDRDLVDVNNQTPYNRRPQPRGAGGLGPINMQSRHYLAPPLQSARVVGDANTQTPHNLWPQLRGGGGMDHANKKKRYYRTPQPRSSRDLGHANTPTQHYRPPRSRRDGDVDHADEWRRYYRPPLSREVGITQRNAQLGDESARVRQWNAEWTGRAGQVLW